MVTLLTLSLVVNATYSFHLQIVKLDPVKNVFSNVIGDFNADNVTVFGRNAMTHWKPVMLVSQVGEVL